MMKKRVRQIVNGWSRGWILYNLLLTQYVCFSGVLRHLPALRYLFEQQNMNLADFYSLLRQHYNATVTSIRDESQERLAFFARDHKQFGNQNMFLQRGPEA